MESIKVSVIIPTYKRSVDIKRAVDSVLSQTLTNIECIVVDDNGVGSEEGEKTAKIIGEYSDERLIYVRHEQNKNGAAARNSGIERARGEYVAFLDDDDIFLPRRLEVLSKRLDELGESYGSAYSAYIKNMADGSRQISNEKAEGDVFLQVLMRSLFIGTGSNLFFRKSAMDDIGLFDVSFRRNQDLEYLTRITKKYKMAYIDEPLMEAFYDVRTSNMTFEQSVEREKLFREKFSPWLSELSDKEKREVLTMYEIDWLRFCISRKKFGKALLTVFKAKIPFYVYCNYASYVLDRMKNKTSYGFVVKLKK